MNSRKRKYILFGAAFIFIAAAAWYANRYFHSAAYFRSKLPEQFQHYPGLDENPVSEHHIIRTLFSGSKVRELAVDSARQTLVVTRWQMGQGDNSHTVERTVHYRLSAAGRLLDSLSGDGENGDWGSAFNGHLLYRQDYDNYLTGGGTQRLAYETVHTTGAGATALQQLSDTLWARADAAQQRYVSDTGEAVFFSIAGKVYRLLLPRESNIRVAYKPGRALQRCEAVTEREYGWAAPGAPLRVAYFLKETYIRRIRPSIMSPAPMNQPGHWEGTAYFDIAGNGDTLRFKHPLYYYPAEKSRGTAYYDHRKWGKPDYFTLPGLNFQLLTVGYDIDDLHRLDGCYLVLPKQ